MLIATTSVAAGTAVHRDFDGPATTWQLLDDRVPMRIQAHECVPDGARNVSGCEHIAIVAPAGQSAQLACATSPVAVIDEFAARMWVKATQPGVQLAARIVLPRSVGVRNRSALSAIVRGDQYGRVGGWQQLVLTDLPKRLAEQVRVLRTEPGASVDPREAFVDAILLLVPGGPNAVEVWTDDLDIDGVVIDDRSGVQPVAFTTTAATLPSPTIRLQGGTLQVDGHALLPRVIEWRGEPLGFLADRGFNTVELAALPTAEQSAEARQLGLWFLCPPPRPDTLDNIGIGLTSDRVLAWQLTDETDGADPNYLRHWADLVRQKDPIFGRPVVVNPESDWESARRAADIVVAGHLLAGRMSNGDFRQWLVGRRQLVEPGTPIWVRLPTQFDKSVGRQCDAFSGHSAPPPNVDDQQLESLARTAATQCSCGFVFSSHTSLAENDSATRRRAAHVELINHRLRLIEPWLAGGKLIGQIESSNAAVSAALVHVDFARLLMPISASADREAAAPRRVGSLAGRTFVVPGVPESSRIFYLSLAELRSVPSQRVTGGMRIEWEADDDGQLLISEDPQAILSLRQRISQDATKVLRLERDLAAAHSAAVADTGRQLASIGLPGGDAKRTTDAVNAQLRQVDALVAAGRLPEAYRLVRTLRPTLALVADAQRRVAGATNEFHIDPLAVSYDRLVDDARFVDSLDAMRRGDNQLFGGDFEDIGQLTIAGWQHVSHPTSGVDARAELSSYEPHHGQYCLELRADTKNSNRAVGQVASAPIWITSPLVHVEQGEVTEITGWARVNEPIQGTVDGLQIVDSLGGPELTLVINETSGWKAFRIIRAVPEATDLRITFALNGLGVAHIDGVMVRTLQQSVARRLPPIDTATETAMGSGVVFGSSTSR